MSKKAIEKKTEVKAEAKKQVKKSPKAETVAKSTKKSEKTAEKAEPKKSKKSKDDAVEKKAPKKTPKTKAESVKSEKLTTGEDRPIAEMFPKEITVDEYLGTFKRADKIKNISEVKAILEKDPESLIIVTYWTKRMIKQYSYGDAYEVPNPKSFENDLDILLPVMACENIDRIFMMSYNSEAMFRFEKDDFKYVEDSDSKGEKFKVRVSAGLEFEIYTK